MLLDTRFTDQFVNRHIGIDQESEKQMLELLGLNTLSELIQETIPASIRLTESLNLPRSSSEYRFINEFKKMAQKNKVFRSFIGQGYHNTITPPVILRNILENPGWYTAYTPYQAEIAQGRLEALINFQTTVIDLTGMEMANASLLDEATAAAEAMSLLFANRKGKKKKSANKFLVSKGVHPQTIEVLLTRSAPIVAIAVIVDENNLADPYSRCGEGC